MNDILQPTQSRTAASTKSAAPRSTSSPKSNGPSASATGRSLNTSLKSKFSNENEISAPAGREIINTSRRKIYIGRAGAGNAMLSSSSPDRQNKVRELLKRDREVLDNYKTQASVNYTTGRGGAGSKGHVKHKGKVPNRERAIAKERDIQARWKEERERLGHLKTGRGGRGNIIKAAQLSDDASSINQPPRAESRLANWTNQERPISAFGTTTSEQGRRRRFSLTHNAGSRSGSSDYRPSTSQGYDRAPSSATNNWDTISDTDSLYDLEVSTGIVTSTVDPSTILSSLLNPSKTAMSTSSSSVRVQANRTPTQVAPFEEPSIPKARKRLSLQVVSNPFKTDASPTTPTNSQPNTLLRPFKKLQIGKPSDASYTAPPNHVIDISAAAAAAHAQEPASINISTSTTVHRYPNDGPVASTALQMIDPSNRNFMPPSRIVSPPPVPTPELPIPAQRHSHPYPYTFNINELGDDDDTASYVESRRTSGTFTFHTNGSFTSTSPSTPNISVSSSSSTLPPTLPTLYFQEPVPARREDISWSKRRLPVPPVRAHRILQPASSHSGLLSLLSPPQTPLHAGFTGSRGATPTATTS